uniref:sialic acid-binding Ig-like lectin 12 n=1 Tax=Pristiophorus japonicus TaxID=55135 RepID=UPI00398EFFE4
MSGEWKVVTPREVTAQEGLCAQIPCQYSYPSHLANHPWVGVWFNTEKQIPWAPLAFHSEDHNLGSLRLHHRTGLSGDLNDGDCSLIINSIRQQDAGPFYFRIEFDNSMSHNYYPVIQFHVSDFTDKPTIFPAGIIAGKCVDISCTFSTTCDGTAPAVTWVNAADVHGSVSNSVTQHGVTLTYTSVLTLIPSLKHHGQTLTCRVSYPSVSSERTLTLTVHFTIEYAAIALSGSAFQIITTPVASGYLANHLKSMPYGYQPFCPWEPFLLNYSINIILNTSVKSPFLLCSKENNMQLHQSGNG